ncbi:MULTISPECIES: HNH endonuclease family protein [Amycolatopsis]|uniref:HNH endonuclease family protein n=1 Tax=Amycolatopsis TaxID=1813 RepID=UPI000B8AC001|nr:HNH endonuclease [Amycolatopsis sp. KNN50.9b]
MKARVWVPFLVVVAVAVLVVVWRPGPVPPSKANPGTDPGVARQQLAELPVKPRGTLNGYSREKYPHWDTVEGTCNTREEVLKRSGQNVVVGKDCSPTSGTWVSPYDGATWTKASDVDIDHLVPLAQSWVSGASAWTQAQREAFANDLVRPQLWAVTDNVNQAKSDKAPDEWKPPLESFWCTYAIDWIEVKHHYQLSVTTAERAALTDMLTRC